MLSIRLVRFGAKKKPSYRIVVMQSQSSCQSKSKDFLGTYDPLKEPKEVKIDLEKAKFWLERGARPSPTVKSLLESVTKQKKLPD
jgi:small subunit ribosomal protein S16